MKVYVVIVNEPVEFGTETYIESVFSSKKKAEEFVKKFNDSIRRKIDMKSAYYEDWIVE